MSMPPIYPFAAIVSQDRMKLGLILNVIDPGIGGVLISGEKGTSKSTAVRGLAEILPSVEVVEGCPFQLSARDAEPLCRDCADRLCERDGTSQSGVHTSRRKIRVVELPIGATEDRLVGTLNLEHALKKGEKRFEPGLLAQAHRGILYVDEVNLLDDHLVDLLLDSAAMGVNRVEREGVSFVHPTRFTLVGTMNPEEGDLRPQLLDRFGLCVVVEGVRDRKARVEIMQRRLAFDEDPAAFVEQWAAPSAEISGRIGTAQRMRDDVVVEDAILERIAKACARLGVDGHRGDIVTLKASRAIAAYEGRAQVLPKDVELAAELALPHRVGQTPVDGDPAQVLADIRQALSVERWTR